MTPATDGQTLEQLRAEVGDELVRELVALFESESAARMEALEQARRAGDRDALSALAHSIKGSALNLGATALARVCARLEQRAGEADAPALVDEVAAELARVRAAFAAALG